MKNNSALTHRSIAALQKLHPKFKKAFNANDWDTYYKLLVKYRKKYEKTNKR